MKLSSLLRERHIVVGLRGPTLMDAVREVLDRADLPRGAVPIEAIRQAIVCREAQARTAMGRGIAIPHARVAGYDDFVVFLGLAPSPIAEQGPDGLPIDTVFVIAGPETKHLLMLQTLGAIASLDPDLLARLRAARTAHEAWRILDYSGAEVRKTLRARDLMRPAPVVVREDTMVREMLDDLTRHGVRTAPVVDPAMAVVGAVGPSQVLDGAFPEYANLLRDLSFLADAEPFEHFFAWVEAARVAQIMDRSPIVVDGDDLYIEVLFRLKKERRQFAFVLNGGRLAGYIDRDDIITGVFRV